MQKTSLCFLLFFLSCLIAVAQDDAEYVKANAVRINNVEQLSDSAYILLKPFRVIMFGEMHGTNESAPFVNGLANLFLSKGDSVQVGFEIPSSKMERFISLGTDSSIYQSDFFSKKPDSGKESVAWATCISKLKDNPRVKIFFFDVNDGDGKPYQRDSLMSAKIKAQFQKHPSWRMVTLTGNYHNRISGEPTTASFLLNDTLLKICSLNMEYSGGSCMANFGHGLELKQLGSYPSPYNTTLGNNFLLLVSPRAGYPYHGFFYTRQITATTLTTRE